LRSVEQPIPSAGEVEDRHVEDKHRIVHSPAAPKHFTPLLAEILSRNFDVSSAKRFSTICFVFVHSICFLLRFNEGGAPHAALRFG